MKKYEVTFNGSTTVMSDQELGAFLRREGLTLNILAKAFTHLQNGTTIKQNGKVVHIKAV